MTGDVSTSVASAPAGIVSKRSGGDIVVEALQRLGVEKIFGLPGQHALGLIEALRQSPIEFIGARIEHNAGFMGDGAARVTRHPSVVVVSAGPGTLATLSALQEALTASSPVVVLAAQIPTAGIGGHHRGFLHELDDQAGHVAGVTKHVWTVDAVEQIPQILFDAWDLAQTPPSGPVCVQLPSDVLETCSSLPITWPALHEASAPSLPDLTEVARLLNAAASPVIYAGGGVVRSDAAGELVQLAERLAAPVVTTFGGRSAMPWSHPLSAQGWIEDIATTEFMEDADVLVAIGTGLGELSTNYRTLRPHGTVIQIDADASRLGANYSAVGVTGDAKAALEQLLPMLEPASSDALDAAHERIGTLLTTVNNRLDAQNLSHERQLLAAVREGIPDDTTTIWDMTMLAYWAWSAWDARGGRFECAQSGGLGFALGTALGAAIASNEPSVAISGDGGAMYAISELGTLCQTGAPVTWLIVNDGGYGVLAEYLTSSYGATYATELSEPDFVALCESFGVAAQKVDVAGLTEALHTGIQSRKPNVVILDTHITLFAPSHLDRLGAPERTE